jgi:plasmid stability protein
LEWPGPRGPEPGTINEWREELANRIEAARGPTLSWPRALMLSQGKRCYHEHVRQLITRLDDDLHARLKARAAAEGRSVNALVVEILAAEVTPSNRRERLRRRAKAAGWLVVPPRPDRAPSWEAVEEATRGAGTAVSEALEAERARR